VTALMPARHFQT